jgi:hypothetical protein
VTTYWFKPKRYGYGATPVVWQGWAVTIAAVATVVVTVLLSQIFVDSSWRLAAPVIIALVIAVLCIVSHRKTDGEWRWRWGKD